MKSRLSKLKFWATVAVVLISALIAHALSSILFRSQQCLARGKKWVGGIGLRDHT